MNYWFYRFNIIDWRVMDIVLVFIDSQLWHKKLKQQNLLSVSGDKKINQTDTNTRDLDKKDCKVYKLQRKVKHLRGCSVVYTPALSGSKKKIY